MTHIDALATAFRALSSRQRANLLWHAEQGTTILCGEKANSWADGKGGG